MADPLDYVTLAEYKTLSEVGAADGSYDAFVPGLITEASEGLNKHLQRQVTPKDDGPTTYTFEITDWLVDLAPYDLRAATLVQLHPEATSPITLTLGNGYTTQPTPAEDGVATDIQISRYQVIISDRLFRFGAAAMAVTGSWGFATVPPLLKRACVVTVQAWGRQRYAPAYHLEDPRDNQPAPPATAELPMAAIRLSNSWRRSAGVA